MEFIQAITNGLRGLITSFGDLANVVMILAGIAAVILLIVPESLVGGRVNDEGKGVFIKIVFGMVLLKILLSMA